MENKFATKKDIQISELALRSDIEKFRSELKCEIQEVQSEMREGFLKVNNRIDSLEDKLIIKLSGVMVVMLTLFTAIGKIL